MIVKIAVPTDEECSSPCQKLDAIRMKHHITDLKQLVRLLKTKGIKTTVQELAMIQERNYLPAFENDAWKLVNQISKTIQT